MLAELGQCCDDIGILVEIQHLYNVHTMFSGCPHNIAGMYRQINVATTLGPTLRQHWQQRCGNVATTVEPYLGPLTKFRTSRASFVFCIIPPISRVHCSQL